MAHWTAAIATAEAIAQGWTDAAGPGGAILLLDTGGLRAIACGGYASIENRQPFGPDTAVRYASISKHFLCGLLLKDGRIGFDDPLGRHLDVGPEQGAVTVGRALDMTGGLADAMETLWLLGIPPTAGLSRHAMQRFVCRVRGLNYQPGTQISYTNTGYRMVQAALAAKGTEYADALAETFFRPLALTMHLPEDETEPVPGLATGYWRGAQGWARGRYGLHFSASGGITGTGRDLASWVHALMVGRGPAEGLLAPLAAPRRLLDGRVTGYGLGLARSPLGDANLIGHGGSLPGFKNHFLIAPELGAAVVIVTNREDVDPHGLTLDVMAAFTGIAQPARATAEALPEGRFIADDAPVWIEHEGGLLTYLGAQEALYARDGGVWSRSVHLPVNLRRDGAGIAGEIGHAARRFIPAPGGAPERGWEGDWVLPAHNARLSIALSGNTATLRIGAGPLTTTMPLDVIAPGMALVERAGDGPWKQRTCLHFTDGELRMITNRSRVLRWQKA